MCCILQWYFWSYPPPEAELAVLFPLNHHLLRNHCRLLLYAVLHLIDNDRHDKHDPFNHHLVELTYAYHNQPVR